MFNIRNGIKLVQKYNMYNKEKGPKFKKQRFMYLIGKQMKKDIRYVLMEEKEAVQPEVNHKIYLTVNLF